MRRPPQSNNRAPPTFSSFLLLLRLKHSRRDDSPTFPPQQPPPWRLRHGARVGKSPWPVRTLGPFAVAIRRCPPLRYDPLGRLYEVNGSATGITRFLNDGDDLVGEYNSSGTLLRRYVHGTGAGDDPQVWFEGSARRGHGIPCPRGRCAQPFGDMLLRVPVRCCQS